MNNRSTAHKFLAVVEVVVVTFAVVPLVTLGIYRLFPGFERWQTDSIGFPFPVFVYLIMLAAVLALIAIWREKPSDFGLTLRGAKEQLDIAAACFFPVVAASIPLGMGVDYRSWPGALLMAVVHIVLLFLLGWLLRKKPSPAGLALLSAGLLLPVQASESSLFAKAAVQFITYAVFVGFGEEILYRGYMQSRLNSVFGKPFTFFGVYWGWGLVITSLLFGLTHVGIIKWIVGMSSAVDLAWGFWTVFSGLIFGYVREKSGGILAPALLHGLPQAIASAVMLFL